MCTAIAYKTKDFYFGRTLDYDLSYKERIVITPRNYNFRFRSFEEIPCHYAIIGTAKIVDNYPLYYDAINEKGLGMAGLNFVGNACYKEISFTKDNVAPFEFIPFILSRCGSLEEAKALIENINLTNTPFSDDLPLAQLHWIISDKQRTITVEPMKSGVKIYENPVGVLTNNPSFPKHLFELNDYMNLSPYDPENRFSDKLPLKLYSRGMGALGLPGDLSSRSRFIRATFTKLNSVSGLGEAESICTFFHIMETVSQTKGCCRLSDNRFEITLYTCCYNADKGIYYYTTYSNRQISAVDMHKENLDGKNLVSYPLISSQQIAFQN